MSAFANTLPSWPLYIASFTVGLWSFAAASATAAELDASDRASGDGFGRSVSISESSVLIGSRDDDGSGSANLFRNIDTATGTLNESVRVVASSRGSEDWFGISSSLSGGSALVGAMRVDGVEEDSGAVYLFRGLDTATGTVTEAATLSFPMATADNFFGRGVGLDGPIGVVGASGSRVHGNQLGAAFVYRGLDTATGTILPSARLAASNVVFQGGFGSVVSVAGTSAAVMQVNEGGAVYIYRNLDTVTGTVTESVRVNAEPFRTWGHEPGLNMSFTGSSMIVGVPRDDVYGSDAGAAYLFQDLDTATSPIFGGPRLFGVGNTASTNFGASVSMSGTVGLIGAPEDDQFGRASGVAYLFTALDRVGAGLNHLSTVRVSDSTPSSFSRFGRSVGIDGDEFVIASYNGAVSGTVSALTTLDEGNASRSIGGFSFKSETDWIIGANTDQNKVTLGEGDTAQILDEDAGVFVGRFKGSDYNILMIDGTLEAGRVTIGSADGNRGNALILGSESSPFLDLVRVAPLNSLYLPGDLAGLDEIRVALGDAVLEAWDETAFLPVDNISFGEFFTTTYSPQTDRTHLFAIPEPTVSLLGLVAASFLICVRRRPCRWVFL